MEMVEIVEEEDEHLRIEYQRIEQREMVEEEKGHPNM
jgi:hypothetical protein